MDATLRMLRPVRAIKTLTPTHADNKTTKPLAPKFNVEGRAVRESGAIKTPTRAPRQNNILSTLNLGERVSSRLRDELEHMGVF
jgi:hypothetical protein